MVIFLLVMDSTIYSFDWALINLILLSFSSLVLVVVWKWQMKNRNKQMHILRLGSITVPTVLLNYFFEFFFYFVFLFSVNHTKGKRVPIAKFLIQQKTILEQLSLLSVIPKCSSKQLLLYIFNTNSLRAGRKIEIFGCWVLYFSFQATFWAPLWMELLESNRNITADHTTIVLWQLTCGWSLVGLSLHLYYTLIIW